MPDFKKFLDFQGGSSLQALSDHLYLDHSGTIKNPVTFRDFQCPHCLTSFEAVSRLFLHLKLCHKGKKKQISSSLSSVILIREIQPTMNMDLDGKKEFIMIFSIFYLVVMSTSRVEGFPARLGVY